MARACSVAWHTAWRSDTSSRPSRSLILPHSRRTRRAGLGQAILGRRIRRVLRQPLARSTGQTRTRKETVPPGQINFPGVDELTTTACAAPEGLTVCTRGWRHAWSVPPHDRLGRRVGLAKERRVRCAVRLDAVRRLTCRTHASLAHAAQRCVGRFLQAVCPGIEGRQSCDAAVQSMAITGRRTAGTWPTLSPSSPPAAAQLERGIRFPPRVLAASGKPSQHGHSRRGMVVSACCHCLLMCLASQLRAVVDPVEH